MVFFYLFGQYFIISSNVYSFISRPPVTLQIEIEKVVEKAEFLYYM